MAAPRELFGLDCEGEDIAGIQLVLRSRLEEMCELRATALDWSDIEGVHDMRVASRRLRSTLADFEPYLRSQTFPKGPVKKIARALGAVRDEDVAIAALEELKTQAEELSDSIELIARERRERQTRARAALEKVITASAMAKFQQEFLERLQRARRAPAARSVRKTAPGTGKTFRQVGVEVITHRAHHLREAGGCLYHPFKTKPLHRMRIMAKRLRYAIELFTPCWDEEISQFAKEAARLQTSLGGLHDCDVWIADIGSRLEQSDSRLEQSDQTKSDEGRPGPNYRAACLWLLRHFARERTKHYGNALERRQQGEEDGFFTRLQAVLDLKPNSAIPKSGDDPAGS
jgi:CHAD domain-containing protein